MPAAACTRPASRPTPMRALRFHSPAATILSPARGTPTLRTGTGRDNLRGTKRPHESASCIKEGLGASSPCAHPEEIMRRPMTAAFGLLLAFTAYPLAAQTSVRACTLLTPAEIGAAVGGTVG